MGPFNIKRLLGRPGTEIIGYSHRGTAVNVAAGGGIWAIVIRSPKTQYPISGINNQVASYSMTIEISAEDVSVVDAGRSDGDQVTLKNNNGVSETLRVVEKIGYDEDQKSWKLGLSK